MRVGTGSQAEALGTKLTGRLGRCKQKRRHQSEGQGEGNEGLVLRARGRGRETTSGEELAAPRNLPWGEWFAGVLTRLIPIGLCTGGVLCPFYRCKTRGSFKDAVIQSPVWPSRDGAWQHVCKPRVFSQAFRVILRFAVLATCSRSCSAGRFTERTIFDSKNRDVASLQAPQRKIVSTDGLLEVFCGFFKQPVSERG